MCLSQRLPQRALPATECINSALMTAQSQGRIVMMRFGIAAAAEPRMENSTRTDMVRIASVTFRRRGLWQGQVRFIGLPRGLRRMLRSFTCTCSDASSCELEAKPTLRTTLRSMPYLASRNSRVGYSKRSILRPRFQQQIVRRSYSSVSSSSILLPPVVSFLPGTAFGGMSETFGARLRRVREEKGFTVPDLAAAVGVSPGAIRQLESGQSKNPGFALGLRIADRLSVDPHYLALGEGFSLTERLELVEERMVKLERRVAAIPLPRR